MPDSKERRRSSLILANLRLLLVPLAAVLALVLAYAAAPSFASWFTTPLISPMVLFLLCLTITIAAIIIATWIKYAWAETRTRLVELASKCSDELEAIKAKNLHLESAMADLRIAAFYDVLTGVPNSRYLKRLLSEPRQPKDERCLILLDLENFGEINKRFNHWKGDQYLSRFATILLQESRRNEYVIKRRPRVSDVDAIETQAFRRNSGGDEFYLLLNGSVADGLGYLSRLRRRAPEFDAMAQQLLGSSHKFGFRAGVVSIGFEELYETAAEKVATALGKAAESKHALVYWPPHTTMHLADRQARLVAAAVMDFGDPFHEPDMGSSTGTG